MALTKADREWIYLSVESIIQKQIEPITKINGQQDAMIGKHNQTLYGTTGNNGLSGDMKTVKKGMNRLVAIGVGMQGLAATVGYFASKIFK